MYNLFSRANRQLLRDLLMATSEIEIFIRLNDSPVQLRLWISRVQDGSSSVFRSEGSGFANQPFANLIALFRRETYADRARV